MSACKTIISCPIPAPLAVFCADDGVLYWRSPLSDQGCEQEGWFRIVGGALTPTCRPEGLLSSCDAQYLNPTCVQDSTGKRYIRYTIVLTSGVALGVLFVDEATGAFSCLEPGDVSAICDATVMVCDTDDVSASISQQQQQRRAQLVKLCDRPEVLLRSNQFVNCETGETLTQEVWYNPGDQTRTLRYYECLTEQAVDAATVDEDQLLKCNPCEPRVLAPTNCLDTAPAIDPTTDVYYVAETPRGAANGTSWANAGTLTNALASAQPEVWVERGAYDASVDGTYTINRAVRVYGGFSTGDEMNREQRNSNPAINGTELTGNDSVRVVSIEGATTLDGTVLDGFTVRNGNGENFGTGVFVSSDATLRHVIARNNTAPRSGAGIRVSNASARLCQVVCRDNTLTDVRFNGGAGLSVQRGMPGSQTFEAVDLQILNNTAQSGNAQVNVGAGMSIIANNISGLSVDATVVNAVFADNVFTPVAGEQVTGGGLAARKLGNNGTLTVQIVNATFANNTLNGNNSSGGGLHVFSEGGTLTATVSNCIMWNNTAATGTQILNGPPATLSINDCLVQDASTTGISGAGITATEQGTPIAVAAIKATDPEFVSASNLRLQRTSPAIDCGFNTHLFTALSSPPFSNPVAADLDGRARVFNDTVDLGAYESACT